MAIIDIIKRILAKLGFKPAEPNRPKISIIIPYGGNDPHRRKVLNWLVDYWRNEIPDSEIIIGYSRAKPFVKTEAFNNAIRRSRGEVLVLLDADAYMSGAVIVRVANRIIEELEQGNHLWYVPYRRLYRLTKNCTRAILHSDPCDPLRMTDPPPDECIHGSRDHSVYGRRYGAMVMVIPRKAFDVIGLFDERFRGWGGEDVSLLRALDTLWSKHKSINTAVYHLYHPQIGSNHRNRRWYGQTKEHPNDNLAMRYHKASRSPSVMRELVDEGAAASRKGRSKRAIELIRRPTKVYRK